MTIRSQKQREIAGLLDAMKKYDLMEGYILTLEDEEILKLDKKNIIIKPIWKWLLQFDNS
jgi:predicted AAA+ superfamily ATPase